MIEAFVRQQSHPCFPIDFRKLGATIEFVELEPGRAYEIGKLTVQTIAQNHPSDSYGFRFTQDKAVVFSTDCEHKFQILNDAYPFIEFFRDADVLIFDAQYSLIRSDLSEGRLGAFEQHDRGGTRAARRRKTSRHVSS